jgi:EAL domain-containing protein (putative c-di-GMP-specific phosphodiesterase class I)
LYQPANGDDRRPRLLGKPRALAHEGFGLSVDDYGTAHSNMQQLLRIPFLGLKIDRSFITGASKNSEMHSALSSCLELARKLRRNSVAVGVETREDWDLLRELGCTYAQGYYIAKPMERDVVNLLKLALH